LNTTRQPSPRACGLAAVLLQAQVDFPLEMPAVVLNVGIGVSLLFVRTFLCLGHV